MIFGRRYARVLEAQLARKDEIIDSLLNRLMARSYEQFHATEPDSFLSQPDPAPSRRLYDSTGLLEVDTDPDDPED